MTVSSDDSPHLFPEMPKNGPDFSPDFSIEDQAMARGHTHVCGCDEAGRGPLAGPVVAAAVILDPNNIPDGLHDSKKLTAATRQRLFGEIMTSAEVAFASVSAATIDLVNIRAASLMAMAQASRLLAVKPDFALIDGNALPTQMPCDARAIVKGDSRSLSIAAASIIAKVMRDRMMVKLDATYPQYGFAGHKGYPTKSHMEVVARHGPCPAHRMTFAPVAKAIDQATMRLDNKKAG